MTMDKKIELVQRLDFIKQICKGKKVLHLGCTNHPYTQDAIDADMLLHFELEKSALELYGFDYDQEGIDVLTKHGSNNLYRADLEALENVDLDETFDIIIAGEMIEHLSNPGLFLKGIQRFMNKETKLVITTINAYCAFRFVQYALRGRGGYAEPVHPDHISYYSFRTLSLVINRSGLKIKDFFFVDLGSEHRPTLQWHYRIVNDVAVKISPQLGDGVIAVCGIE